MDYESSLSGTKRFIWEMVGSSYARDKDGMHSAFVAAEAFMYYKISDISCLKHNSLFSINDYKY